MKIHKEGYASLLLTTIVLLVLNLLVEYFFPEREMLQGISWGISLVLFFIVLQFFRSPNRITELGESTVISPADGKVVVIEEVYETEFFQDRRLQISVFMSPINVHVNRNPVSGIVKYSKYHPGKYLVAWHPKSSTDNERTTVVIENSSRIQVLFRQVAGVLARRIVNYLKEGQEVVQGQEMGFIKFGSRIDLYLPLNTDVKVALNEKVKGGVTVLAEIHPMV